MTTWHRGRGSLYRWHRAVVSGGHRSNPELALLNVQPDREHHYSHEAGIQLQVQRSRSDGTRFSFQGSLDVFGKPNNPITSGAFITRGDDIKLPVDCTPGWESYEHKKLDLANDSDKKFFE